MTETSPELASRTETRMRALSLWQPYATGIAIGIKRFETRGRITHIRGDVAIHAAALSYDPVSLPSLLLDGLWFERDKIPGCYGNVRELLSWLPKMVIVAVVEIWECWPTERLIGSRNPLTHMEIAWGNYGPGRFGWALRNLRRLKEPVPCKGKQGFFFLPDDVAMKVRAQI